MDLNSLKNVFKKKDGKAENSAKPAAGRPQTKAAARAAASERGGAPLRVTKITPVSPSRARLERRANDEKIIKNIKITFMTIVILAVVGIAVSIFLYVYRPAVATVDRSAISQHEFIYQLNMAAANASAYSLPETIGNSAMNGAAQTKALEIIARERGIALTPDEKDGIESQMQYIEQIASSESSGRNARMTGDDYLRDNLGVTKAQYRQILENETLINRLMETLYNETVVPEDDVRYYFESNAGVFEIATVRHILFLYEGKAGYRDQDESERMANDIAERIKAGDDMVELVWEYSEDTDLTNDGVYEFRRTESYEPAFINWTFNEGNQVGDVGVCETSYGYHVMRLEDVRPSQFEDVSEEIIEDVKSSELNTQLETWFGSARFQPVINQGVYESLIKQVLG